MGIGKLSTTVLAVLLLSSAAGRVAAQEYGTIQAPQAYLRSSQPYSFPDELPAIGEEIIYEGVASSFGGGLQDLNADGVEFTIVADGCLVERVDVGVLRRVFYTTGALTIFRDLSPDADFMAPSTFRDGEAIFTGPAFIAMGLAAPGEVGVSFHIDGGTEVQRVTGMVGITLVFVHRPAVEAAAEVSETLKGAGYFLAVPLDNPINAAVPVTPVTWSRIKAVLPRE